MEKTKQPKNNKMYNVADVKESMASYKKAIDLRLRHFLNSRLKKSSNISSHAKEIMEHIMEFSLRGGKRIRPILVLIGYKAYGGKNEKAILGASIAVELMESYLLIHDDIMDQDELRRGYLTMHKIYENNAKRKHSFDAELYGESMGIIAGDILAALGSEALLSSFFPCDRKLKAVDVFNKTVVNTCIGQVHDIELSRSEKVTESDIMKLYLLKTALYTIDAPLQIGAILAGADDTKLKSIREISIPMGRAFQLQDDILGIFGSEKKLGKPVGSDIREGKKTLLIVKAMQHAGEKDKNYIAKALGNPHISNKDIEKVREIIIKTGSLEYCKKMAAEMIFEAKKAIYSSEMKTESKNFLLGLSAYMLEREY